MKVFLAGATGALGKRLVPLLVTAGHEVVGLTRSLDKAGRLRDLGAQPAVADALDAEAVRQAVRRAEPEVVIHQLTALQGVSSFRKFDDEFALTNRLRTEGTDHLLAAALEVRARRFIAQSYAGWPSGREGTGLATESDPLDPAPLPQQARSLAALRHLEDAVLGATDLDGVVLRYAGFYGPGTGLEIGGDLAEQVVRRRLPIVGDGAGVWSFVHIDDAASATMAALQATRGVYNVVDDEPAPVARWLPELARALGAKPPHRIPVWLGRLAAGQVGVAMMTQIRGVSSARIRTELGWRPSYPTYREGFAEGLASS